MLWEGFKLMGVGMATVMLFLLMMIACIEWVRHLNRDFTALEQQKHQERRKSSKTLTKSEALPTVPVEVFAAAITTFESDKNTS